MFSTIIIYTAAGVSALRMEDADQLGNSWHDAQADAFRQIAWDAECAEERRSEHRNASIAEVNLNELAHVFKHFDLLEQSMEKRNLAFKRMCQLMDDPNSQDDWSPGDAQYRYNKGDACFTLTNVIETVVYNLLYRITNSVYGTTARNENVDFTPVRLIFHDLVTRARASWQHQPRLFKKQASRLIAAKISPNQSYVDVILQHVDIHPYYFDHSYFSRWANPSFAFEEIAHIRSSFCFSEVDIKNFDDILTEAETKFHMLMNEQEKEIAPPPPGVAQGNETEGHEADVTCNPCTIA